MRLVRRYLARRKGLIGVEGDNAALLAVTLFCHDHLLPSYIG
jgi:hypothetical protein